MPRYSYHCIQCENDYEDDAQIVKRDESVCIRCGSDNTKRYPSSVPFHLKGSGWNRQLKKSPNPSIERRIEDRSFKS